MKLQLVKEKKNIGEDLNHKVKHEKKMGLF